MEEQQQVHYVQIIHCLTFRHAEFIESLQDKYSDLAYESYDCRACSLSYCHRHKHSMLLPTNHRLDACLDGLTRLSGSIPGWSPRTAAQQVQEQEWHSKSTRAKRGATPRRKDLDYGDLPGDATASELSSLPPLLAAGLVAAAAVASACSRTSSRGPRPSPRRR
jgi:hypothetical protein